MTRPIKCISISRQSDPPSILSRLMSGLAVTIAPFRLLQRGKREGKAR